MVKTAGLISVIIPIHNRGSLLRPCLDSVSAQTDKRIEVLLVDDGSTEALDGAYDYLRRTPSAKQKTSKGISPPYCPEALPGIVPRWNSDVFEFLS